MLSKNQKIGLFILRIGLGSFFLLWGLDKLFASDSTVMIFKMFYKLPIEVSVATVIGVVECLFGLAFMAGWQKKYVYGLGVVLHGISTLSTYSQLLNPFGKNHLFIAALPVLAGYITLYLLRDEDTFYSVV
jgi:putative oxidoreductase